MSCDFCERIETDVTKCPCCNKSACFECDATCDYCNSIVCEEDIKKCPSCKGRRNTKYVCVKCIEKEFKKCQTCKKLVCGGGCLFEIKQNDEVRYLCNACFKSDILLPKTADQKNEPDTNKPPKDIVLGFCVKCKTIQQKTDLLPCDKCNRLSCKPYDSDEPTCFEECNFCQEILCNLCVPFITKCRSAKHPLETFVSCGQCSTSCSQCLNSFCPLCIKKCPECQKVYCVECEPSFHCGICISCISSSSQTLLIDY